MRRWITPLSPLAPWLLAATAALGCSETVDGQRPVLSDEPAPVEMERFARRLHLDLAGKVASDSYISSSVESLTTAGNSAPARADLADTLLGSQDFAQTYVGELENQLFGGEDALDRYNLLCGIIRGTVPACDACATPSPESLCASCTCANLPALETERLALVSSAEALAASDITTAEIGRRYAAATPLRQLQGPDATAQSLFEAFLGRLAEAEELRNAQMMIFGFVLSPDAPSGLLFQRHGSDYDDLVDIIFESDVYREASVNAVFLRYLGRSATPVELAHFSAEMDPTDPDIRPVIRAVTSSREYFEQ